MTQDESRTFVSRVIDRESVHGNSAAAKSMITIALNHDVDLQLNEIMARNYLGTVKASRPETFKDLGKRIDREEKAAAARRNFESQQQEAKRAEASSKVQVFSKIVGKFKALPNINPELAKKLDRTELQLQMAKRTEWEKEVVALLDEFERLPFSPKEHVREAREMLKTFDDKLNGNYSGEFYRRLLSMMEAIANELEKVKN